VVLSPQYSLSRRTSLIFVTRLFVDIFLPSSTCLVNKLSPLIPINEKATSDFDNYFWVSVKMMPLSPGGWGKGNTMITKGFR
jgi:hypothetical protein